MSAKCQKRTSRCLFDHLVGALLKRQRYAQTECFGGLKIDHQLIFRRSLNRHTGRLLAFEDAINIASSSAIWVNRVRPITDQTTIGDEEAKWVGCWQSVPSCQRDDEAHVINCQRHCDRNQTAI